MTAWLGETKFFRLIDVAKGLTRVELLSLFGVNVSGPGACLRQCKLHSRRGYTNCMFVDPPDLRQFVEHLRKPISCSRQTLRGSIGLFGDEHRQSRLVCQAGRVTGLWSSVTPTTIYYHLK